MILIIRMEVSDCSKITRFPLPLCGYDLSNLHNLTLTFFSSHSPFLPLISTFALYVKKQKTSYFFALFFFFFFVSCINYARFIHFCFDIFLTFITRRWKNYDSVPWMTSTTFMREKSKKKKKKSFGERLHFK